MTASSGYTHWNIGKADAENNWVDSNGFFDATNTLSEAKDVVDWAVRNQEVA